MPPPTRDLDDFASLFRYTRRANDRALSTMQHAEKVPGRAVGLVSHLLRVQDTWHGRVQGTAHADLFLWAEEGPGGVRRTGQGKREALGGASHTVFAGRPRPSCRAREL